MVDEPKQEMLSRWRSMARQCQETLEVWETSGLQIVVNGIDISDAERAATVARIKHLQALIAAVEAQPD